jgi:sestrin
LNINNREKRGSANAYTVKLMELLKKGISEDGENKDKVNDFVNAGTESTTENSRRNSTPLPDMRNDLSRYTGSVEMRHYDFDVKSKNYNIFLVQEYGWKEHGYELLRRFYPDIADLLDEEFTQTYSMTYNTFSTSTHIDTLPFRRAIWYYVQRVKGMCHDDYNYQEVNLLLNRDVKFFVKKIACMPDSITQHDFDDLGLELRPEEKCHIALLAMESHKQACLLYGLHAVMQYMNRY